MKDHTRRDREGFGAWMGVLTAVKDAVDESMTELSRRGDASSEEARDAFEDGLDRARSAAEEARRRMDVVSRREFQDLRADVAELKRRVAELEGDGGVREIPVEEE